MCVLFVYGEMSRRGLGVGHVCAEVAADVVSSVGTYVQR